MRARARAYHLISLFISLHVIFFFRASVRPQLTPHTHVYTYTTLCIVTASANHTGKHTFTALGHPATQSYDQSIEGRGGCGGRSSGSDDEEKIRVLYATFIGRWWP